MKVGDLIAHKGWLSKGKGVIMEVFSSGEYFRIYWFDAGLETTIEHTDTLQKLSIGEQNESR